MHFYFFILRKSFEVLYRTTFFQKVVVIVKVVIVVVVVVAIIVISIGIESGIILSLK